METSKILLVKPHPPQEILKQQCPVPEKEKYFWEPISLKLAAKKIGEAFHDSVEVEIWHLMSNKDDWDFLERIADTDPLFVIFTEIDILVNEVNALAQKIKNISKDICTIVGGKQTSLLRKGDRYPFHHIDYAIRGDGLQSLIKLIELKQKGEAINEIEGLVRVTDSGIVAGKDDFSPREMCFDFDLTELHSMVVVNHSFAEYLDIYHNHPSILPGKVRTSPLFIGTGCVRNCSFCQSSVEYTNGNGRRAIFASPKAVAREIEWLHKEYNVKIFFSLEPNMNLDNLLEVYIELEKCGIDTIPISGFIRAGDILLYKKNGILEKLRDKGVRVLSIGLDFPFNSKEDIYSKDYMFDEMMKSLDISEEMGILVLGTVFASSYVEQEDLRNLLDKVKSLPLAEVDVRFAIALRNTQYFKEVENFLVYHPDFDQRYFDHQNYRYQTIQYPGKITPEESYRQVNAFYNAFLFSKRHLEYVSRMVNSHPDTKPFFRRQYQESKGWTKTGDPFCR